MGSVNATHFTNLSGLKDTDLQCDNKPPLALLYLQDVTADRTVFGIGNEIHTGRCTTVVSRRPTHLCTRPPRQLGMVTK